MESKPKIKAHEISVHAKSGRILMADVQREVARINECFGGLRKFSVKRHTDLDDLTLPDGFFFCEENKHLIAAAHAEKDANLIVGSLSRIKKAIHFSTTIKEMYEHLTGINSGLGGINTDTT